MWPKDGQDSLNSQGKLKNKVKFSFLLILKD
jgi:hypothetical protein